MRTTTITVTLTLLLSACGDSEPQTGALDVVLPDTDTAVCAALGADFTANVGTLAVLGLPSMTVVKDVAPGAISGDPVLRAHGDKLYVVNRGAANITILEPGRRTWKVAAQFSTGAGSNPHDLALAGDKAYVALYDRGDLQVWDLSSGSPTAPQRTIDLSGYDEDGVPQASSVVVVGGRAYVALGLLPPEVFPPTRNGKIAVIDTANDAVVTAFELRHPNPYDFMYPRGDRLVVSTFADYSGTAGCLEQIALDGEPRALDCLVENSDVNGVISAIGVTPVDTYLAVSRFDAAFNQDGEIRRLAADGTLAAAAVTPPGQVPTDLAWSPSGHLVYSDRNGRGLRVLDLATGAERTTAPLDIGLAPATANAIVCLPR
jgi:DNA-binding beta-propeller fold protein YncE